MSICGKISANVVLDCDYPLVGGANDNLYLINKEDYDDATITVDPANDQLITDLVLETGTHAYKFEGKNNSVEPRSVLVKQRYAEVYDHEVIFKVFINSADTKVQLEKMAKGKVIAIIENNYKGDTGAGAFEVYGVETGLQVMEMERVIADADTQGAYNVTLRTSEFAKESHLPSTLLKTDYATTKSLVEGLAV